MIWCEWRKLPLCGAGYQRWRRYEGYFKPGNRRNSTDGNKQIPDLRGVTTALPWTGWEIAAGSQMRQSIAAPKSLRTRGYGYLIVLGRPDTSQASEANARGATKISHFSQRKRDTDQT